MLHLRKDVACDETHRDSRPTGSRQDVVGADGGPPTLEPPTVAMRYASIVAAFEKAALRKPGATIERLCARIGIRYRTCHRAFLMIRRETPQRRLRALRLEAARNELLTGRSNVTETAASYGFEETGRFAKYYRAAFGELPSQTILQARAGRAGNSETLSR